MPVKFCHPNISRVVWYLCVNEIVYKRDMNFPVTINF